MVRAAGGYGQNSCGGGTSSLGYLLGADSPTKPAPPVVQEGEAPAPPAGPTAMVYDQYTQNEIRKMTLKDLRVELRARGLSPAGGKEALEERLLESVAAGPAAAPAPAPAAAQDAAPAAADDGGLGGFGQNPSGSSSNAYARPDGQNCGNFITDRSSSRVLAPPGGGSSITFG